MDNNIDDYEGGSNIVDVWPRYLAPLDRYVSTNWRTNNYHYNGEEEDQKLDQGALGMSDPLEPLQLALKPNSASSINRPLLNFYYCAH